MKKTAAVILLLFALVSAASAFSINVDPPSLWLSVKPGSSTSGKIIVENRGNDDINVKAYAQDWVYAKDRSKEFKKAGTAKYSCSNWIAIYPSDFTLASKKSQEVSYTLTSPTDASGGYYSVIFFESRIPDLTGIQKRSNVVMSGRIGAIVYLDTDGRSDKLASIKTLSVEGPDTNNHINIDIQFANDGNTILSPEGNVIITDSTSRLYAKIDLKKFYVLQGETVSVKGSWFGGLKEGEYDVIATFDVGKDMPVSAKTTLIVKPGK